MSRHLIKIRPKTNWHQVFRQKIPVICQQTDKQISKEKKMLFLTAHEDNKTRML